MASKPDLKTALAGYIDEQHKQLERDKTALAVNMAMLLSHTNITFEQLAHTNPDVSFALGKNKVREDMLQDLQSLVGSQATGNVVEPPFDK